MALYVAVSHTGKTLQLGVQPGQRVDAIQQALVAFTSIPAGEQILMLNGVKLDPARPLSSYKLPFVSVLFMNFYHVKEDPGLAADNPVYLYSKAHLKPGAALPQSEHLPPITAQVPPAPTDQVFVSSLSAHPLAQSSQEAVRSLPSHELSYSHHVATAVALWEASGSRLHRCRQLLSEQEVQARAADAATVNVETHYKWITDSVTDFMARYQHQCTQHAQLLASFAEEQALLDTIALPAGLQVSGMKTLAGVPAAVKAREVASACRKYHGQFAEKVTQLESLYESLKLDMEDLIMQAPSVDLDALGSQLTEAEGWAQEQEAAVQALNRDLNNLQRLVEHVVRRFSGSPGPHTVVNAAMSPSTSSFTTISPPNHFTPSAAASSQAQHGAGAATSALTKALPKQGEALTELQFAELSNQLAASPQSLPQLLEVCQVVQILSHGHANQVLPRVQTLDACMAVLEEKCVAAKGQMTADVISMLQRISGQQSKIRDMRGRLSAFDALLQRQATLFAELRPLGRLPAAYRAVLAECERRRSWHQLKTSQAAEWLDQLLQQYNKEAVKRQALVHQVERYLPREMLGAAGLDNASGLPLPTITIPPPPEGLLPVSLQDIQRLPATPTTVSVTMAAMTRLLNPGDAGGAAGQQAQPAAEGSQQEGGIEHSGRRKYASALPDPSSMHKLELENARLRAELADLLVATALEKLQVSKSQAQHTQQGSGVFRPSNKDLTASVIAAGTAHAHHVHTSSSGAATGQTGVPSTGMLSPPHGHSTSTSGVGAASPSLMRTASGNASASQWRRQNSLNAAGSAGTAAAASAGSEPLPGSGSLPIAMQQPSGPAVTGVTGQPASTGMITTHLSTGVSPQETLQTVGSLPASGGGLATTAVRPPLPVPVSAAATPSPSMPGTPAAGHINLAAGLAMTSSLHHRTSANADASAGAAASPLNGTPTVSLALPGITGRGVAGVNTLSSQQDHDLQGHLESQAVAALQRAIEVKQEFCEVLQHELHALNDKVLLYASRIEALEEVLSQQQAQHRQAIDSLLRTSPESSSQHTQVDATVNRDSLPAPRQEPIANQQPQPADPSSSMADAAAQSDITFSSAVKSASIQSVSSAIAAAAEAPLTRTHTLDQQQQQQQPQSHTQRHHAPGAAADSVIMADSSMLLDPAASMQMSSLLENRSVLTSSPVHHARTPAAATTTMSPISDHSGVPLTMMNNRPALGPIALAALAGSRGATPEPKAATPSSEPCASTSHGRQQRSASTSAGLTQAGFDAPPNTVGASTAGLFSQHALQPAVAAMTSMHASWTGPSVAMMAATRDLNSAAPAGNALMSSQSVGYPIAASAAGSQGATAVAGQISGAATASPLALLQRGGPWQSHPFFMTHQPSANLLSSQVLPGATAVSTSSTERVARSRSSVDGRHVAAAIGPGPFSWQGVAAAVAAGDTASAVTSRITPFVAPIGTGSGCDEVHSSTPTATPAAATDSEAQSTHIGPFEAPADSNTQDRGDSGEGSKQQSGTAQTVLAATTEASNAEGEVGSHAHDLQMGVELPSKVRNEATTPTGAASAPAFGVSVAAAAGLSSPTTSSADSVGDDYCSADEGYHVDGDDDSQGQNDDGADVCVGDDARPRRHQHHHLRGGHDLAEGEGDDVGDDDDDNDVGDEGARSHHDHGNREMQDEGSPPDIDDL